MKLRGRFLLRLHLHLEAFFDENGMDFRVPGWWEVVKVPLVQFGEI